MNITDVSIASYILVPIDEAKICIEGEVSLKDLLHDIEEKVELEENPYSSLYPFDSAFWATYNETSYQIAIRENLIVDGEKIDEKRQASIQILKIILEKSPLKDKVSVNDYKTLKINLKAL